MKAATKAAIATAIVALLALGAKLGYDRLYEANGFFRNAIDSYMRPPWSETKVLAIVAAAVMLPAFLLGVLEWRADRAFRRELRRLREADVMADVVAYEGPEGSGVLVLGAHGQRLLLRPLAGLGAPKLVEMAPTPTEGS